MATAPGYFDHTALLEITITPVGADEIRDGRGAVAKMLRWGVVWTVLALASLFVVAVADARLLDDAFLRVFGWF